jgi:hypothetical protein
MPSGRTAAWKKPCGGRLQGLCRATITNLRSSSTRLDPLFRRLLLRPDLPK